jgi:LCP family protein required for cell wall assembly
VPTSKQAKAVSSPTKKAPKRKHFPAWLGLSLGLTGVALLSATAGALLAMSLSSTSLLQSRLRPEDHGTFNQSEIANGSMSLPSLTRPVNVLVIGSKVLRSELGGDLEASGHDPMVNSLDGLSDSMLLVRFEPDSGKVKVLSIPRDTQAVVEGIGETKINEANHLGGPGLTARTVSRLLDGVGIDRYVRVNLMAVEAMVDALGGVDVYVPSDMKYTDNTQHLYIDLKEGQQRLNGEQAIQFMRFRYDDLGDIGRIQRQQMLLRSLIEQAIGPMTLVRLPKILSVVQDYIDTNLSIEELVALLNFTKDISHADAQMLMLPGNFNTPASPVSPSYWLPDYERIDTMVAEHFGRGQQNREAWMADPSYANVAIQNSTGDTAAVQTFMDALIASGYRNVYDDYPWNEPLAVTQIIAQNGDTQMAESLRQTLGFGEVRVESTGVLESDITIRLGRDWLQQQQKYAKPDAGAI